VFAGVAVLVLLVPLNVYVLKRQGELLGEALCFKDARLRLYNEILSGIKVSLKYRFGWDLAVRSDHRSQVRAPAVAVNQPFVPI
jgi:hypothetical protein